MTKRKMTRLEKKKAKDIKVQNKSAKKIRKQLASTLNWMDIKQITDDCIYLERGKEKMMVKGIKLKPHDLLLDDDAVRQQWIDAVRFANNQIKCDLFYQFVYAPVDLDDYLNSLDEAFQSEDNPVYQSMIHSDQNKGYEFQKTHKEINFFVMIRDRDEKYLKKNLQELYAYFDEAGFSPEILNKRDFYNYVAFLFENTTINDYCFSRGILSYLNIHMEYDAAKDQYEAMDDSENFAQYGNPIPNVVPDPEKHGRKSQNLIQRSKIAPTSLKFYRNYIEMSGKLIRCLLVRNLPPVYNIAILTNYLNDPSIKVSLALKHSSYPIQKMLHKELQRKQDQLRKSTNEMEQRQIVQDIQTQREFIDDIVRKNDVTWNVQIIFEVAADNLKDLNDRTRRLQDRLQNEGWKIVTGAGLQEQLFKAATPVFMHTGEDPTIEENYSLPLTSDGVAGLWPWIYETLEDKSGILLGEELQNGGKILLDPFFYLHQPDEAAMNNRVSGNFVVAGRAGSGKTTAANIITRSFIKNKTLTIWVDPENKNERLTKKYGGTFIDWGKRGNIINPFDLKPLSFAADDNSPDQEKKKYDTELAIFNVIDDIKQIFRYLWNISDDELSLVGDLVKASYAKVGIVPDENKHYPSFKSFGPERYPTFSDFNDVIKLAIDHYEGKEGYEEDIKLLRSLQRKVSSLVNEWSVYLNGHTTINDAVAHRNIVSFGTKSLQDIDEHLSNALYHIMFKFSWALCLDERQESAFIVDEAHTIILKGSTASLLSQFVRRSRKYRNVMMIITQEPRDFADERVLTEGKAIFNNSVYKIILGLEHDAVTELRKLVTLNDNEAYMIERFTQGCALLMCGNRHIPIHVMATHQELAEMGAMFY